MARERRRKTTFAGIVIIVAGLTHRPKPVGATGLRERGFSVPDRADSSGESKGRRGGKLGGTYAAALLVLRWPRNTDGFALRLRLFVANAVAVHWRSRSCRLPLFLSQALLFSRLLDLHELLGKAIVFGSLALILALLYGLLVIWAGTAPIFFFNTFLASSLILILYDPCGPTLKKRPLECFREHVTFKRELRAKLHGGWPPPSI